MNNEPAPTRAEKQSATLAKARTRTGRSPARRFA